MIEPNASATASPSGPGPDDYVLRAGHPKDPTKPDWYLFHGPPEANRCIGGFGRLDHRAAQNRARRELRRRGVRVLRWEAVGADRGLPLYRAVTGPVSAGWRVAAYEGNDGTVWWNDPHRGWHNPNQRPHWYPSLETLDNVHGPLVAIRVDGLANLVEETAILTARTVYYRGPEECHERECDGYDLDGNVIADPDTGRIDPDRQVCHHLEPLIAGSGDSIAMDHVRDALKSLREEVAAATVPVDTTDNCPCPCGTLARNRGLLDAVDAIEAAMRTYEDRC